ncbi:MAG: RNA polymerase sporulation sigma factor SigK [Oscillospiraceae bacterium]|jgi:RNA polymerase sporulation-specific sigma factor|nr:RNA polymerase sporulation sigma factor SigK [Oscillospiraceae bacterium]
MLTPAILWLLKDALFFLGYMAGRSSFPKPLPAAEERAAVQRWLTQKDEAARNTLVEHNLRLVAHIARKYTVPGMEADDLISIGTIGLIKGVSTFRPASGTQLSTYCARCIENEILMSLRAAQKRKGDVSLQDPIGTDSEGNEIALIDVLGTEPNQVIEAVDRICAIEKMQRLLATLPKRERMVLQMRYGLLDGVARPQHEIAKALGISRSYVSRIEKHAIGLLNQGLQSREPAPQ